MAETEQGGLPLEDAVERVATATLLDKYEREAGLMRPGPGRRPYENLHNVRTLLRVHPGLKGCWRFDTFAVRLQSRWRAPDWREAVEAEATALTAYLQRRFEMPHLKVRTVEEALTLVGLEQQVDPLRAYVEGLAWDGVPRLDGWLVRHFGVEDTEYARMAGTNWLVGMAARALRPGCQMQNMVLLEGRQGIGKSMGVRALVPDAMFGETTDSIANKDFFVSLSGKWLVEIGELSALRGASEERIKSVISMPSTRYRAPFARDAQDHPRRCVFVGTTNSDVHYSDVTGARRFWPVKCGRVDVDGIARDRDQLFAEARALLEAGATWWEMPAEWTRREQEERREGSVMEDEVRRFRAYVLQGTEWVERAEPLREMTVRQVLVEVMQKPLAQITKADEMRAGAALRALGAVRRQRFGGDRYYVFED